MKASRRSRSRCSSSSSGAALSDLVHFLEGLPPGALYVLIGVFAALENVFPPVPADTAVALGAFLAGRGTLDGTTVFGITWAANTASAALVFWLARRYGRDFFRGPVGRRLLPETVLGHLESQYHRHGTYGIFLSRLLPVWRSVVPPFAGIVGLSPARALIPLVLASGAWYGALTLLVMRLGTSFDVVVAVLGRVNRVLGVGALLLIAAAIVLVVRRLKR